MNENQSESRELTMLDMFKIVKGKIRIIAIITLVATIIGAVGGVLLTFVSNMTYGTQAEFHISSDSANSQILPLLSSDRFAETLLLDENGLPSDKKKTPEYKEALALKERIQEIREEIKTLSKDIDKNAIVLSNLQRTYDIAQAEYTEVYNHLILYKSAEAETIIDKDAHEAMIQSLEGELSVAREDKKEAREALEAKRLLNQEADQKMKDLKEELIDRREELEDALNVVLADFRADSDNVKKVQKIKSALSFEYSLAKDEKLNENKALLYANISAKFDKEFATFVLEETTKKLPTFIEETILPTKSTTDPEDIVFVRTLSVFGKASVVGYKNPLIQGTVWGVIAFIAAFAMSCFAVIVIDIITYPSKKAAEVAVIEAEKEEKKEAPEELQAQDVAQE